MLNSDFENNVKGELDDLSFEPSEAVWDRVEAQLPGKNRRRWLLLFIPLFLAGAIFLIARYNNPATGRQEAASNTSAAAQTTNNQQTPLNSEGAGSAVLVDSVTPNTNVHVQIPVPHYQPSIQKAARKSAGNSTAPAHSATPQNPDVLLTEQGNITAHIKKVEPEAVKNDLEFSTQSAQEIEGVSSSSSKNDDPSIDTVSAVKTHVAISSNSTDTVVTEIPKDKNKKKKQTWTLGATVGAGIANLKSGLFNNSPIYRDVIGSAPSGIPASPPTTSSSPSQPSPSLAFTAGISAEKNLNDRITFQTGLIYSYLSSRIEVGPRVDSGGNFTTSSGNTLVTSYYSSGTIGNYVNRFHFISIPVTFSFTPVKQLPLYAEAGLTTSYLIKSNNLQYSSIQNAYFRNEKSYNRLLFGMQGGIGAQLKSFKAGYRFNYSLSSVIKDASPQYPVSSTIYLQIPIKKF